MDVEPAAPWPDDNATFPFEPFPETALEGSVTDRFDSIATRYPERLAVSDETVSLTYAELADLARRIAASCGAATANRGGQVAILLRNEARYAAAMLGILASGRAFVPLNADHPLDRNIVIVIHAGVTAIISAGELARTMRDAIQADIPVLDLDAPDTHPPMPKTVRAAPDDLAYIPYTSGSTGRPKGVERHHRSLLHYAWQTSNAMQLGPSDRMVSFNSQSLTEGLIITFCALLNGASLHCLAPTNVPPATLAAKLRARRISVVWSVPRLFRHLVEALRPGERFDSLRLVSLAGDRVDWSDVATARHGCGADARIRVGFGSTEAGVHAQWFVDEALRGTSMRLPVGQAPAGQRLLLCTDDGDPVADGEIGEVIVASRSVALGYRQDPEATSRAFALDAADPTTRTYRTGDLALRRPDGLIEYVGRKDQQIKLSGQRVELSEVECALMSCNGVRDAAVVVRRNASGVPRSLSAWCEMQPPATDFSSRDVGAMLAAVLPQYMVPATITIVADLPRLANFKIDREELRRRDDAAQQARPSAAPQTATEALLADLWSQAFAADAISRDDDFFTLGGDSLAAATISVGVQDALGGEIDLGTFAEHATLAELAAAIDGMVAAAPGDAPLVPVSRAAPLPLSHIQQAIWNNAPTPSLAARYFDTTAYRLLGMLDVAALRVAIDGVVARHESLRTTFRLVDGHPAQVVHPAMPVAMPLIDLGDAPDPQAEARRWVQQERSQPVAVRDGTLLRFAVLRLSDGEHWLVQTTCHAICDASSRAVFTWELGELYAARIHGEAPPLPGPLPLQYGDYAAWQRTALRPEAPHYQEEVAWWQSLFAAVPDTPDLPFLRKARVAGLAPAAGIIRWEMTPHTARRTIELARDERTTPYVVRLAAFAALLAANTGEPIVVIGAYVENRRRRVLQDMIGSFVNDVILKLDCQPALSFRQWVRLVAGHMAQVMAHSEIPGQSLHAELAARGVPVPAIRVLCHSFVLARLALSGLDVSLADRGYTTMPVAFTLTFREHDEDRDCSVAFDAEHYDPVQIGEFVNRFIRLLEAAVETPQTMLESLVVFQPPRVSPRARWSLWRVIAGRLPRPLLRAIRSRLRR